MEPHLVNRKVNSNKCKVPWLKIKGIKVKKCNPEIMNYIFQYKRLWSYQLQQKCERTAKRFGFSRFVLFVPNWTFHKCSKEDRSSLSLKVHSTSSPLILAEPAITRTLSWTLIWPCWWFRQFLIVMTMNLLISYKGFPLLYF